jgi:hypothetical protein
VDYQNENGLLMIWIHCVDDLSFWVHIKSYWTITNVISNSWMIHGWFMDVFSINHCIDHRFLLHVYGTWLNSLCTAQRWIKAQCIGLDT